MSSIPTNPDALLLREQTSQALKESGYPVETSTLATKASRGGGPRFRKFGVRVLYRWGDALQWAQSRLSAPRGNTSEGDAIDKAARSRNAPPSSAEMESMPHTGEGEPRTSDEAKPSVKPSRSGEATARRRPRQRNRGEAEATPS